MARRAKVYKTKKQKKKEAPTSPVLSPAQTPAERAQAAFAYRVREFLLDLL